MTPVNSPDVIDAEILDQAVHWFVAAHSGLMDARQRAQLESWRNADSRHDEAWQRLTALGGQLRGRVGSEVASAALQRAGARRRVLKALAAVGVFGAVGWRARETSWGQGVFADYHTATGERRTIELADGGRLLLNTATAVNVQFDAYQRRVVVKAGEIAITTAHDSRPLIVEAGAAELRPIGTRFSVRRDAPGGGVWLAVTEGRVAARSPGVGDELIVEAGQGARITAAGVAAPQSLTAADTAWTDGMIVASRMRLADFLTELGRYRPGLLRCDPAVAELRLTGAYPLDDTDRVLDAVAQTLSVSLVYRTRWLVSVGPRTAS